MKGNDPRFEQFKLYNFSGLKGQTRVSKSGLEFVSSLATLVFACPSKLFIDYFLKLLFEYPTIDIGNLKLSPTACEVEEKIKFGDEHKFICISPMILRQPSTDDEENKRFIYPDATHFSKLLYHSTIERMRSSGAYSEDKLSSYSEFEIEPDDKYLTRMNNKQKKFARVYPVYYKDIRFEVRGYTLPFKLVAPQEIQDFIFTCGIGALTEMGFGMLDLAHADPKARVEEYALSDVI